LIAHLRRPAFPLEFVPEPGRRDADFGGGLIDADLEDASLNRVEVEVSVLGGLLAGYRLSFAGDVK
jgi:hypothetical protein